MAFCQLVIGAPGSGKSTYCRGMQQFLTAIGRETIIVNLDPANEDVTYDCVVNVTDLITVEDVMQEYGLGLNGSLIFCMEWLEKNIDLLKERLDAFDSKYILFDCPGQAELYTHHLSMRNIIYTIQRKWSFHPVVVHLVDSHLCVDPNHFIAGLIMSLASMQHLELPQVNVLSKVDLFEQYSGAAFSLDYYTDAMDLGYLQRHIEPDIDLSENDDSDSGDVLEVAMNAGDEHKSGTNRPTVPPPLSSSSLSLPNVSDADRSGNVPSVEAYIKGHKRLTSAICEMIEEYALVNFIPLAIDDKYAMMDLVKAIDRGNGYVFAEMDLSKVQLGVDSSSSEHLDEQNDNSFNSQNLQIMPRSRH